MISEYARCTYYNPDNNDPSGSYEGAFEKRLTPLNQSKYRSIAMLIHGGPYMKLGLYTITGKNWGGKYFVTVEDTCENWQDVHFDIFMLDIQIFLSDYCYIKYGCEEKFFEKS